MTQEQSGLLMVALAVLALSGAAWGWRRRKASYRPWAEFFTWCEPGADVRDVQECLYVGTSEAGLPLQRVAVGPLSYRAKATLGFSTDGLVLGIRGAEPLLLPYAHSVLAGRATWTIDRGVEPDGLLMIQWSLGPHRVESYFRMVDSNLEQIVSTINEAAGADTQ